MFSHCGPRERERERVTPILGVYPSVSVNFQLGGTRRGSRLTKYLFHVEPNVMDVKVYRINVNVHVQGGENFDSTKFFTTSPFREHFMWRHFFLLGRASFGELFPRSKKETLHIIRIMYLYVQKELFVN